MPYLHTSVLADNTSICPPLLRLPAKLNDIVKKEIDMMLQTKVAKLANSPWGFHVVIARKKGGPSRFCVDYGELNRHMKADDYPIPIIQEVRNDRGLTAGHYFWKGFP